MVRACWGPPTTTLDPGHLSVHPADIKELVRAQGSNNVIVTSADRALLKRRQQDDPSMGWGALGDLRGACPFGGADRQQHGNQVLEGS